ncbi:glycosyltransferase family 4 protein [Pontibacter silvestris]|uniref:Glycosyltransferase family 4 protein n=1 Tax=Pontibacter silvestris TaxID=2305183 RepID=A0ABW4WW16_9BACT|nr:glycosyltransferase family 4 protein [Pontibacter silvestris]MCC9137344.1 glycosyltransferase family 4 protein [Pontibacter silvestris]
MKIAFFTHYTSLYGANRSLINLIKGLNSYGVDPVVIVPNKGELLSVLEDLNINYLILNFSLDFIDKNLNSYNVKSLYFKSKLLYYNYRSANRIARILKNYHLEAIYSNSSVFYTGFYVSKLLNLPHLWHIREFAELQYQLYPNFGYSLFKLLLRSSKALIFVSKCLRDYYVNDNCSKSYIIYNGVETKKAVLKYKNRELNTSKDEFIFCIVGLIHHDKGQIDAIKAFEIVKRKFKNVKLKIAGGGNAQQLQSYVNTNKIEDVSFLGVVSDPFSVFLSSDVSLMCSKNEAMGRVTVESMCCKTPVIGRNSAATKELINHKITGLLYDGSIESLALQMEELIVNDVLYKAIAESCWKWAYDNFTQEKYADSVFRILQQNFYKE